MADRGRGARDNNDLMEHRTQILGTLVHNQGGESTEYRGLHDPPKFEEGFNPKGAQRWLADVEKVFNAIKCREEHKVSYATYLLCGEAEDWWKQQIPHLLWLLATSSPAQVSCRRPKAWDSVDHVNSELTSYITRNCHIKVHTMQPSPPLSENPGSAAAPAALLDRTYRVWKGNNVFCLRGRLIFGPDVKSMFLSTFLIVAPTSVFCAFVLRKLVDGFPNHLGWSIMIAVIVLTLFVLITLVLTSGRDPGIVPRNAHPPEPDDDHVTANINDGQSPQPRLPRTRDVIVNGITVKVKYCDTCMLYRPLRCSHCSICDNCVERFDHHCPWVGQCIGVRNYRFYYLFIFSTTLLCLNVHGFCWVYIKKIMDSEEKSILKAMIGTPASTALIAYTFICVWFVGGLTVFHTYLISTNQSTYENFRYQFDEDGYPYDRGIVGNFKEVFCTSIPPSRHNFRSKVPREPVVDSYQEMGIRSRSPMRRSSTRIMELAGRPVHSGSDEEEKDYRDGFHDGGDSKYSGLNLQTEGGEGNEISPGKRPMGGRPGGKCYIPPEVGESSESASESSSGSNSKGLHIA
ncbi:probable protein S-acyltransferase 6 [Abrus precatorius]|uniref:S-acyltransferase n=1 Tax=Abrus precatorius TaxID=3816 RepID=A0A8B8KH69_ABRPR|nr:probable protein S-acyltransferase 6 [Abrus precatorius]